MNFPTKHPAPQGCRSLQGEVNPTPTMDLMASFKAGGIPSCRSFGCFVFNAFETKSLGLHFGQNTIADARLGIPPNCRLADASGTCWQRGVRRVTLHVRWYDVDIAQLRGCRQGFGWSAQDNKLLKGRYKGLTRLPLGCLPVAT